MRVYGRLLRILRHLKGELSNGSQTWWLVTVEVEAMMITLHPRVYVQPMT